VLVTYSHPMRAVLDQVLLHPTKGVEANTQLARLDDAVCQTTKVLIA